MFDDTAYFEKMTWNAEQWAEYWHERVQALATPELRTAEALRRIKKEILQIIRDELKAALMSHEGIEGDEGEYTRLVWVKEHLLRAFHNIEIVEQSINLETGKMYLADGAYDIVGDEIDFYEGVRGAYAIIDEPTGTLQQRAAFWKNIVWESDTLYNKTIRARHIGWGDKAPYWIWLEVGNIGMEGAHPQFEGQHFLAAAQDRAEALLQQSKDQVENEEWNVVEQTYANFLLDPAAFPAYDVIGEFYAEGQKYLIHITLSERYGKRLGVRKARTRPLY